MLRLKCQQMARGFNFIDIIKRKSVQSRIPLITRGGGGCVEEGASL